MNGVGGVRIPNMHPTPSASPAPYSYRLRSAAQHTDGPSPSKRRKLATPAAASSSSSSLGYPDHSPDPQLDTERRASSSRVLNVWSSLEDKYARRLDEDDIVDLRSGGLVKDRGVLSSKAGVWDIGCFADPEEVRSHVNTTQEDDNEEDEIGVWGSDTELDHRFNPVPLPPVRELDPEDAEDLRAFLAAEEARKALHGNDEDVSEDEAELDYKGNEQAFDARADTEGSILEVEAGSPLALSPTESDDELAGYDETVGEGALLWEVSTELSNCTEPLSADTDGAPHPLHALPRRNQTPAQLHTPPHSYSSMISTNGTDVSNVSPFSPPVDRPSLNLPSLSPPKSRKPPASVSPAKEPPSAQPSTVKSTKKPVVLLSRQPRHSTSTPRRPATISSPVPTLPSHDFWRPYPRSNHTPTPAFSMPYPPPPHHTRESSMAPHPETQLYIAQALQSLSYFAFGSPLSASPSSRLSHYPHPQHPSASPLHSPSPWSYPRPYYSPDHPQTHASVPPPPWPYPPYPYQPFLTPHGHLGTAASPISSATPLPIPSLTGEPPSSSPEFSSSPLSGRSKRKRVSFPQEVVQSDPGSDSDVRTRKSKGKGKALNAIPRGHPRRDSSSRKKQ